MFAPSRAVCTANSPCRRISTTPNRCSLEEFLPDLSLRPNERNISGRSWSVSDLRQKSDVDLHKLWYVLLKERNMLATLRWSARRLRVEMPAQERVRKVQTSMDNLRRVIIERDNVYLEAVQERRDMIKEAESASLEVGEVKSGMSSSVEVDLADEPWFKLHEFRAMTKDAKSSYLSRKRKECEVEDRPRQLHTALRDKVKKKYERLEYVRRRWPKYHNAPSPWVRPNPKTRRYQARYHAVKFFRGGKLFSIPR